MIEINKKNFLWPSLLTLLLFFNYGCTSSWKKIDENLLPEITEVDTTKSDILFMFGEPNSKGFYSGHEIWSYKYLSGNIIAGIETKIINIYFSESSVTEYLYVH